MKQLLPVSLALLLGACATTQPLDAADVRYSLPRTDVAATLTIKIRGCEPLAADTSVTIASKAGAQDAVYEIPGSALVSGRIKRGLKISINGNGVIKSVNAASSDRTPQIIGNYVKIGATLAGGRAGTALAFVPATSGPACKPEVAAAAARAAVIQRQIRALRLQLADSKANRPSALDLARMSEVKRLAAELGSLETILTADVSGAIKLDPPPKDGVPGSATTGTQKKAKKRAANVPDPQELKAKATEGKVEFDPTDFKSLFDNPSQAQIDSAFSLAWTAQTADPPLSAINRAEWSRPSRAYHEPCDFWMAVPRVRTVSVQVSGAANALTADVAITRKMPVAQWSDEPAKLCLDAAFGETKALELAFDDYGRVTDYNWTSESSGEAISGALAGASPDIVTLGTSLRSPSALDSMTAEANTLEMGQKLRALRACQVILDAGGECPKE